MTHVPLIERAFELAQSGRFTSVSEVDRALRDEGYQTLGQLSGFDIRRRLTSLCRGLGNVPAKPARRRGAKTSRPAIL